MQICDAGVVFLPGAGGTVQEVFQDACENYYADESSVAPMVLVGVEYWTETIPAWPLLQSLARGRPMEPHVHLVDSVGDAAGLVSLNGCRQLSHQRSTRRPRRVSHLEGSPTPSSMSNQTRPLGVRSSSHLPSAVCLARRWSIASPSLGSGLPSPRGAAARK